MPVWEICGHEFTKHNVHTANGISMRFPRVARVREDKTWQTVTTLPELQVHRLRLLINYQIERRRTRNNVAFVLLVYSFTRTAFIPNIQNGCQFENFTFFECERFIADKKTTCQLEIIEFESRIERIADETQSEARHSRTS